MSGAIVAFLLGGSSSRINVVILPFAVAAIALGACAVLHRQGRPVITSLYFLASLAVVYGILAMIAVPVRLAIIGTCAPEPARCGLGLERPLTGAEDTAMTFAIGIGIVAILTGFFGLVVLYGQTLIRLSTPPARRIDPVVATPPAETGPPPTASPSQPEIASQPEPVASEPEPMAELPAPAEALELPPPAAAGPTHEDAPQAAARRNPRRRRTSKAPPESPPGPNIDA